MEVATTIGTESLERHVALREIQINKANPEDKILLTE
jgi:hypothetical protein